MFKVGDIVEYDYNLGLRTDISGEWKIVKIHYDMFSIADMVQGNKTASCCTHYLKLKESKMTKTDKINEILNKVRNRDTKKHHKEETVEDIIEEVVALSESYNPVFNKDHINYFVSFNTDNIKWSVGEDCEWNNLGTLYFTNNLSMAEFYVKRLNEATERTCI